MAKNLSFCAKTIVPSAPLSVMFTHLSAASLPLHKEGKMLHQICGEPVGVGLCARPRKLHDPAAGFLPPSDEGGGFLRSKKTEGETRSALPCFVISPSVSPQAARQLPRQRELHVTSVLCTLSRERMEPLSYDVASNLHNPAAAVIANRRRRCGNP